MPEQAGELWAVVELLGHCKIAGRLTDEEKFGAKMGRLDIPTVEACDCANAPNKLADLPSVQCDRCKGTGIFNGFVTTWFGGASVYRVTAVSEAVARKVASKMDSAPVQSWDFPKGIPFMPMARPDDYGEDADA